jgi:restriction endonuclease S subunit
MGKAPPAYPKGVTFEQVWASIQAMREEAAIRSVEADRRSKELDRKIDRQIEEAAIRSKEIDRQLEETKQLIEENAREAARERKEYNKRFGDFSNRFGEIVEYMVAPNLREKFRVLGLDFPGANSNFDVEDPKNDIYLEVDVFLANGDKVMLV